MRRPDATKQSWMSPSKEVEKEILNHFGCEIRFLIAAAIAEVRVSIHVAFVGEDNLHFWPQVFLGKV